MAFIGVVGKLGTGSDYASSGYTRIMKQVVASMDGMLRTAYFVPVTGANCWIKVFRPLGSYYVFIGEVGPFSGNGLQTVTVAIPIAAGDMIGMYNGGDFVRGNSLGGSGYIVYKSGNITYDTLKSGWTSDIGYIRLAGDIHSTPGVL